MTVFVYVNTGKQVGDPEHMKVFATTDAAGPLAIVWQALGSLQTVRRCQLKYGPSGGLGLGP